MINQFKIALGIFILYTLLSTSLQANEQISTELLSDELFQIESDEKIYYSKKDGNINVIDFSKKTIENLSDENFVYRSNFSISNSGRYIFFGSTYKDYSKQSVFLYDTLKKQTIKIFDTPKFDGFDVAFSPDEQTLAFINVDIPHRQDINNEGLFLIDLNTLNQSFITYPESAKISQSEVLGSEIKWSESGNDLYIRFISNIEGVVTREFFRLEINDKKYKKIEGSYIESVYQTQFIEGDILIKTHEIDALQSDRGLNTLKAPNQLKSAYIDESYKLIFENSDGQEVVVDKGEYNECAGQTIHINSWFNGSRYLVFTNNSVRYIYDSLRDKKLVLFNDPQVVFGWR